MKPGSLAIVVPCYKVASRFELISEAIHSVLLQTCLPDELIIVDDCSPDATGELIERELLPKCRAKLETRLITLPKNGGVCAARNAGINECRSEYIAFLDYDDLLFPEYCERVLAEFAKRKDQFVLTATIFWTKFDERIKADTLPLPSNINDWSFEEVACYCLQHNFPVAMGSAIAYPRSVSLGEKGVVFDEFLTRETAEDVLFGYQLIQAGLRPYFIHQPGVVHRTITSGSLSRSAEAFFNKDELITHDRIYALAEKELLDSFRERLPDAVAVIEEKLRARRLRFQLKSAIMNRRYSEVVRTALGSLRLFRITLQFYIERAPLLRGLIHRYHFKKKSSSGKHSVSVQTLLNEINAR
jgi:glycosyltransferase involved in cell wall biosynthesis